MNNCTQSKEANRELFHKVKKGRMWILSHTRYFSCEFFHNPASSVLLHPRKRCTITPSKSVLLHGVNYFTYRLNGVLLHPNKSVLLHPLLCSRSNLSGLYRHAIGRSYMRCIGRLHDRVLTPQRICRRLCGRLYGRSIGRLYVGVYVGGYIGRICGRLCRAHVGAGQAQGNAGECVAHYPRRTTDKN